jgi:hypothetical protein
MGRAEPAPELAYRIALAHVQIASGLLRSHFAADRRAPRPSRSSRRAPTCKTLAILRNVACWVVRTEGSKSHIVMSLNIPVWQELTD